MPDRVDLKRGQTVNQHTLEKCHKAISSAMYDEDGLDGADGEYILSLIRDSLGYDPARPCAHSKRFQPCDGEHRRKRAPDA